MASFNFARADIDWEVGRKLSKVASTLESLTVPGNANQRLFPQEEGTPLYELKQLLKPGQDPAPEEFDFDLGVVLTYADAVSECEREGVNITDVLTAKGGRLYFDTNLGRQEAKADREISKPENADPHVELSKCRFFDTARSVIDWKSTLPGLKTLAKERKYTAEMMQTCLRKLVSEYCKPHVRIVEDMTHNEMANYLLSTENNIDRTIHKKRDLHDLTRMPKDDLRVSLITARNLINKIYPADGANNAAARSSAWRTAILSFLPDQVALPLLDKMSARTEDCNPMTDEELFEYAIHMDEKEKVPLSFPLPYGRKLGACSVMNLIHFNSVDTGFHQYGMPMGGYGSPYQAYQAYPPLLDDPSRRQAPAMNPVVAAAEMQAGLQEVIRREVAAQVQLQATHAGASQLAASHQQAIATPSTSASAQPGARYDLAKQGQIDPHTPERSQEAREAATDSVRRAILNSPYQNSREDGARSSLHDHGHDPKVMTSGENQGQGSKGHAYGTRSASRSQAAATQVTQPDKIEEVIQLLAVTLAEVQKNSQPRGQSRDQSYRRGQVSNGRYTSRERSTSQAGDRPPSRNGGRDRSQSRGRDPRDQRSSNRDSADSAGRFPSYRRAESRSPGRTSGNQKQSSETRYSRSASRGRTGNTSRPTSGFMRTNYPELRDNVNCRSGYNPLKEKHCTKCYPTASHHEFLCKNYHYYCSEKCSVCGRGHHLDLECKDKVETFPPRVGESHLGKLAKN